MHKGGTGEVNQSLATRRRTGCLGSGLHRGGNGTWQEGLEESGAQWRSPDVG